MAIRTELCRFDAADGEALHGLLFQPQASDPTDLAILQVHGVGGAFYRGALPAVGQILADRGYHVNGVRKHAAKLMVPLLAMAGGRESELFHLHARELADAAGPEHGTCHFVDGASHSYEGYQPILADTVEDWLRQVV